MQNRKEFRSFTNYHTYYCEKVQGIQRSHSIWQGRKVQLNVFELWPLRWHCIRNYHVLNIATWAQEYFRKPLSFTTVCCCIKKCNLNLLLEEKAIQQFYAAMLPGSLDQSSSQKVKNTVEMCAVLRWVHISTCFWEKWVSSSQSKDHPDFHQWQMQKQTPVVVWGSFMGRPCQFSVCMCYNSRVF